MDPLTLMLSMSLSPELPVQPHLDHSVVAARQDANRVNDTLAWLRRRIDSEIEVLQSGASCLQSASDWAGIGRCQQFVQHGLVLPRPLLTAVEDAQEHTPPDPIR